MTDVVVVGAAAVSPLGLAWRDLGDAAAIPHPQTLLASTHPGVHGFEVPAIPEDRDAGDPKSRRLMARAARFAAIAAREALHEAGWGDRDGVGYWLGVGASAGPLGEFVTMLRIAVDAGALSLARLGGEALLASNPLNTFHVLNNFTMCHGAILEGTTGPNGALFSRGAGTVHALAEAVWAIREGDCTRALAGGADTALHPVTWAEFVRERAGLVPSEGAAVLALAARDDTTPLARVDAVTVGAPRLRADLDLVVTAASGAPARARLAPIVAAARPHETIDATAHLGEALAATPALAWLVALDRIVAGRARHAAILSLGVDDELCAVELSEPPC